MASVPSFPEFKPIEISDRAIIQERLDAFQPETSELTFTNLFIWRSTFETRWSLHRDWLLFTGKGHGVDFGFPPVGPLPRKPVALALLQWLRDEKELAQPCIERADGRLVAEFEDESATLGLEPQREHFDYVYRASDLIQLPGRKYHAKRNHVSRFRRENRFVYVDLGERYIQECLGLAEDWCGIRQCAEDLSLSGEWEAVREALIHFMPLGIRGGGILIGDRLEAFCLGEMLNPRTAVIHVEKANPLLPGLYAVINQQFCESAWKEATFINREQDLGEEGLRKAKQSYHPDKLVAKFRIRLTG